MSEMYEAACEIREPIAGLRDAVERIADILERKPSLAAASDTSSEKHLQSIRGLIKAVRHGRACRYVDKATREAAEAAVDALADIRVRTVAALLDALRELRGES